METKSKKSEVSIIDQLEAKKLVKTDEYKKAQELLLKNNPLIVITDSKSYDVAKKSAYALRTARTTLQGEEKKIVSKISVFRKTLGNLYEDIKGITLERENKFKELIGAWEERKEREAAEKAAAAQKLYDDNVEEITIFFRGLSEAVQRIEYAEILSMAAKIEAEVGAVDATKYGAAQDVFEEQEIALGLYYQAKVSNLQIVEGQRVAQEKIDAENKRLAQERETQEAAAKKLAYERKEFAVHQRQQMCVIVAERNGYVYDVEAEGLVYVKGDHKFNFEINKNLELDATPEEVEECIKRINKKEATKIEHQRRLALLEPYRHLTNDLYSFLNSTTEEFENDLFELANTPEVADKKIAEIEVVNPETVEVVHDNQLGEMDAESHTLESCDEAWERRMRKLTKEQLIQMLKSLLTQSDN